jgi:uncharacterized protein (TIGR02466 family)
MIKIKSRIESIFPTPIYFSNIERNLTKQELNFIEKEKNTLVKNEGNYTSKNNYILKNKSLSKIKDFLEICTKNYFDNIVLPVTKITPYITQSWLNFTKINEYHHTHCHPNSYISGVFYIKCDDGDGISFSKNVYNQIKIDASKLNIFNADSWDYGLKTGDVILFPSYLQHAVKIRNIDKSIRTSLAFNVFVKGNLGNNQNLTELIL